MKRIAIIAAFAFTLLEGCKTVPKPRAGGGSAASCNDFASSFACDNNSACKWSPEDTRCKSTAEALATSCARHKSPGFCEENQCRWNFETSRCDELDQTNLTCRDYSTQALCKSPTLGDQCLWDAAQKMCNDNPAAVVDCPSKTPKIMCDKSPAQCKWDAATNACVAIPAAQPPPANPPPAPLPTNRCSSYAKEDECAKRKIRCIWDATKCVEKFIIPCHMFAQRDCQSIVNSGQCTFAGGVCKNIDPVPCNMFKNIVHCRLYPACQWRLLGWECYTL